MRNRLLASAGLGLLALAATATITPAMAQDCGCRDQVRAALKRQHPAPARATRPAPVAATAQASSHQANAYAYNEARPVDMYPYRHRWEVAPQGPVAPPQESYMETYGEYAPPMPYGGAYGPPMAYAPPATAKPTHYANPDATNGYTPGYGGSYGASNQLRQWRADAFAPKASK